MWLCTSSVMWLCTSSVMWLCTSSVMWLCTSSVCFLLATFPLSGAALRHVHQAPGHIKAAALLLCGGVCHRLIKLHTVSPFDQSCTLCHHLIKAARCAFRDFDIEPKAEFLNFTYDLEAFATAVGALQATSYIPPGKGYVSDPRTCVASSKFSCST